jgi:glycosyltransferase involved in cell wall biosynthesis
MKFLYLRTVFWFGLKAGGSVGHTSGVINALSKRAELDVISNDCLVGVHKKIRIISPGFFRLIPFRFGEMFYNIVLIKKLKKTIGNYDYIYHRFSGLSFLAAHFSRNFNIPLILEFNSSDVWKLKYWSKQSFFLATLIARTANSFKMPIVKRIEDYNLKNALLIIVPSKSLKISLTKRGIPCQKILVNPNGVDLKNYSPKVSGYEIREKYNLGNSKLIGFIGTFAQWHGVEELAKSIVIFFNSNPECLKNVKFLLIGEGRLMRTIKTIINKSGYKHNVIFTGLIPQNEGPKYLAACDILLSPHIKNPDGSNFFGSPTKLFEYMAMGKPIIASNLDQIGELLNHRKTAFLVEPGDIQELANAMKTLIRNPQLRGILGMNAHTEVLQKYTWEENVNKILKKLEHIKKNVKFKKF